MFRFRTHLAYALRSLSYTFGVPLAFGDSSGVSRVFLKRSRVAAVPKPSIMILANEEVISALLGAMVELDDHIAVFPGANERPLTAIARCRPDLVLLDCEHELAWDAQAMRSIPATGAQVLLFSAMRSQREIDQIAARYGIAAFVLPVAFREFTAHVDRILGTGFDAAIGA